MVAGMDRGTGAPPPPRSVPRKRSKALEQAKLSQHKQAVQLPDGTKKKKCQNLCHRDVENKWGG